MNEIAKNELYYIISMITDNQTANIEYDNVRQRYYIKCKVAFTFTQEQFEALKSAKRELI